MTEDSEHSIHVNVQTHFVAAQSDPAQDRYVFAYTITIRNEGPVAARLLTRRWVITDANGRVQEVAGEGVVGEQPQIGPGEQYEYTSGALIETPVGAMEGSYGMRAADGEHFEAAIAAFTLAIPGALH